MARYYKYKTANDLVADAKRLGHEISVSDDFSVLFQPIRIGALESENRLAVQPMEGCDCTPDGHPDELTYRRYRRFGAGGAGIIWGEAAAIAPDGRMNARQLQINETTAPSIEKMLQGCITARRESIGDENVIVGLQLTHSGRYAFQKPKIAVHDRWLDFRTLDKSTGKMVDENYPLLTDDELKQLEDRYVAAAKIAANIGFHFVDIKQCHRYLLSELLGAKTRPGEYGGSFENRTRFIRNVVCRIKEECPSLEIGTRFNACDGIPFHSEEPGGIGVPQKPDGPFDCAFGTNQDDHTQEDLSEPIELAKHMADWGVTIMNVSCGNPYSNPHYVRPAEFAPVDAYQAPEHPLLGVLRHIRVTAAIQNAVPNVPVIGSGYSWLQDYALHVGAANVANGLASIVGMGRATLSHPDFAKVLKETGKMNRKQICRTFSYCTNLMRTKDHPLGQYATGCPPFDKETYGPLWDEVKAKTAKS
ncbi:MAG: NADH:flavin oxidoreductase [Planctomycetaceae bacterium]